MKKLLFVVAVAALGLTTSCTKECSACTVVTAGFAPAPATTQKFSTAETCATAKAGAESSKGLQTYTCD
jgi:hypothetical protein